MNQDYFLLICQIGMGLFWIVTYIFIIKRGFHDEQYGMPMVAICANISWEFIFTFIYPHNDFQRIITFSWFVLDLVIMWQYLIYGRKEFKNTMSTTLFYTSFLFTLATSFLVILALSHELHDMQRIYAAFIQNLMMSGLFIGLFFARGSLAGQSMSIAVCKMIGTLFAAVAFYFYSSIPLITIISMATFMYDCLVPVTQTILNIVPVTQTI
ncbi:hypothetical protein [Lysinibacillus varians]|uniref:Uncharacterized protein n=1 Tax=Lysinibacillus varians TaxID=1145276 RepID=A0ABY2TEP7_9BACI|nr:hypothetical protein [Lysinibacillus varians]AHN21349.1 membrane protein [Lysinibacillus varians]TKI67121.1 hypothetical protein FC752_02565 [Lysinibacillus varians]